MPDRILRSSCSDCAKETDHKLLHETFFDHVEKDEYEHTWTTTHRMLECCGCHSVSLVRILSSTAYDDIEVQQYPPAVSRRKPTWANDPQSDIPADIDSLMDEVYAALHAGSLRLAAMGTRTLVDLLMTDLVKDIGGFGAKLNALVADDFITKRQRDTLEAALDAGSAAAHRGHRPSTHDLNLVMDIVEGIISQTYVHPDAGSRLKGATPPRRKKS